MDRSIDYPPRLPLANLPTPLQPLRRLQQRTGGPLIWLKRDDLTGSVLTGNKVRKLEFILAHAQQQNCEAVITCGGVQSNHCRATAFAAAQIGLKCHLILRGDPDTANEGNLLLDTIAGATVEIHPPREYARDIEKLFAKQVTRFDQQGKKTQVIPTGGSDGLGIWGYIAACEELAQDFETANVRPSAIICATGSGGTQAGLMVGTELHELNLPVYGINVCDDAAWFERKIAGDLDDWQYRFPEYAKSHDWASLQTRVIDGYVGEGYGRASAEVIDTIKQLARVEGVVFDPVYTGKAFNGLLNELEKGRFDHAKNIVFVHTGGVFGVFPYANLF